MTKYILFSVVFLIPLVGLFSSIFLLSTAQRRLQLGLLSSGVLLALFVAFGGIVSGTPQPVQVSAVSGMLFHFVVLMILASFGSRIFRNSSAAWWSGIILLLSISLLVDEIIPSLLALGITFMLHSHASHLDEFQVTHREEQFGVVSLFSFVAIVLIVLVGLLCLRNGITTFSELNASVDSLSRSFRIVISLLLFIGLGLFPFHLWIRPLFSAPSRYGFAVITRVQMGFVLWAKIGGVVLSSDPALDLFFNVGCTVTLLYSSLLLFGERRLTQIVSSLYLFHTSLLLAVCRMGGTASLRDILLDLANTTVAIGGLLILLGMVRDRVGAERIDSTSGLAISYPLFGIVFLVCILSLVGFPGTLGFITLEAMLHHFSESSWFITGALIVALTLNSYSTFRIFGESFYGDPSQEYHPLFQPLRREKIALAGVVLFLLFCGLRPGWIREWIYSDFSLLAEAEAEEDGQMWIALGADGKFSEKLPSWKWYAEAQPRFGNRLHDVERFLIGPSIGYQYSENLSFWLGYYWTPLYLDGAYHHHFTDEHRTWEQVAYRHEVNTLQVLHRVRLENRFIGTTTEAQRLRYMLRGTYPLGETPKGMAYGVTGYDEPFINLDDASPGIRSGMDRNRIFVGGYLGTSDWRLELGYLDELGQRPGRDDRHIRGAALTFVVHS